jgi:quercetin dioxygenase-like cupin family protein
MFARRIVMSVALALAAGIAAAQAQAPTVTRTPLLTQDLPIAGDYVATLVSVTIPAGGREGLPRHPGTLVAYVTEGTLTLDYEGKPTATLKAGDSFSVEAGKVHEGINRGSVPVKLIATFIVPKDQPMTTQVTK